MAQFALLVPYLASEEITEIVLQSDRAPYMKLADQYVPITSGVMTTAQIEEIVAGTALAALVASAGPEGTPTQVVLDGKPRLALVLRRGGVLQIRIATRPPAQKVARAGAAAAPAPTADPPSPPSRRRRASLAAHPAASGGPDRPRRRNSGATHTAVKPSEAAPPVKPSPPPPADTPPAGEVGEVGEAPKPKPKPFVHPKPSLEGLIAVLAAARAEGASDVHVVSGRPVLVRRAGELTPQGKDLSHEEVQAMLMPLLDLPQREALGSRGYVDLGAEYPASGRARVNVSRHKTGLKGSFRLVMAPLPTLESLGLPADVARATTYHQGLVVIAGPSGHGKTTTLAAIVDIINTTRSHHILTVEEPVEFVHPPKRAVVSQRDVGAHTKSFATALKASLREDPDVIVIGELRDRETVEIAMTAAETGHLVIATMSTPSAGKTIDRLIDLFPPEDQQQVRVTLAGALKFVVAQRLLPNVAGDAFVPAVEILTGSTPLWALIRDNKLFQLPSLQQRGRAFGILRLDESLLELVRAGKISEETALAAAENRKELAAQFAATKAPEAPAPPPAPGQAAQAAQVLAGFAARAKGLFGGKS